MIYSVETNKKVDGFITCSKCKRVLKYSSNTGTSNALAHAKKHEATGQTVTMDKFVLKRKTAISAADKTKLIDAGVNLVSKDLRPFAFVEGMIDLARTLWNLGAIYGSVSNEEMIDIMPCTRAISKNVRIKAKDKKTKCTHFY